MVKLGRNKLKALNKLAKKQKPVTENASNKVLKKKLVAEKKVSFQKEVLLKQAAVGDSPLVQNVTARKIILGELSKKKNTRKAKDESTEVEQKPKQKSVEKHKKRQKTQINDTKMLLKLMKKK